MSGVQGGVHMLLGGLEAVMFVSALSVFSLLDVCVVWWVVGWAGLFSVCGLVNGSVGLGGLVGDTAPCSS